MDEHLQQQPGWYWLRMWRGRVYHAVHEGVLTNFSGVVTARCGATPLGRHRLAGWVVRKSDAENRERPALRRACQQCWELVPPTAEGVTT